MAARAQPVGASNIAAFRHAGERPYKELSQLSFFQFESYIA